MCVCDGVCVCALQKCYDMSGSHPFDPSYCGFLKSPLLSAAVVLFVLLACISIDYQVQWETMMRHHTSTSHSNDDRDGNGNTASIRLITHDVGSIGTYKDVQVRTQRNLRLKKMRM